MPVLAPPAAAAPADTTTPAIEAILAALSMAPPISDELEPPDSHEPAPVEEPAAGTVGVGPFGHGKIRLRGRDDG